MTSSHFRLGLCLIAASQAACFDDSVEARPPTLLVDVDPLEHVVGIPFDAEITIAADKGLYEVDFLLDPALTGSDGEMVTVEQFEHDTRGEATTRIEHEIVCLFAAPSARAIAQLRYQGGDDVLAESGVTINCIAPNAGETDGSDGSDGSDDSDDSDGSDTTDDTGGASFDADVLAFDFAEFGYAISLNEPPTMSEGTPVEVQTSRLRAERDGDSYRVLVHYEAGATERGVLYGVIEDDVEGLERFELPDATVLVDNAFNGTEFVLTTLDAGIYLFDGTSMIEANAPSGATAVECNGLVCIAAAQPIGVLRSEDGGANWATRPGQDFALSGLAYGNGLFVAYDAFNGQMLASDDDGESWATGTFDGVNGPSPIEFGNGTFVGPDVATGTILYSNDGLSWDTGTTPIGINAVSYSDRAQAWVGISAAGALHAVTSSDGETWSELDGVMGQSIFSTVVGLD